MNPYRKLLITSLLLLGIVSAGTLGFLITEGYSPLDAFAVTISLITTTAIGYGEDMPMTLPGKILTLTLIVIGVSMVAYAFSNIVGLVLEGHLSNILGRSKMQKKISNLKGHIIVCGAGRVGQHIVERLIAENIPFVVIDSNEETTSRLIEQGALAINDDATRDEVLIKAGIERARGLITALPNDAENVFVALTGRGLKTDIRIVARGEHSESKSKLIRAGADKVIAPSVIGGRRMAISILKPTSVDFVETLIHKNTIEFEMEEILTLPGSSLVGKSLMQSKIKQTTGTMIIAIKRKEEIITNPRADACIEEGDLLIAIGTRPQLSLLEQMAAREKEA